MFGGLGMARPVDVRAQAHDQDSVAPELDLYNFDLIGRQDGLPSTRDGDGAMLGRVLIFAIIIAAVIVVVALAMWKQNG